ncbi:MAG: cobalamin-binding protein [Gammaproteobacteria bacterium]|jgi:methanogenic corrinoid protein MtbC1|nr:cobalamin-binding protein [Gammaproteobacteria bacterium]
MSSFERKGGPPRSGDEESRSAAAPAVDSDSSTLLRTIEGQVIPRLLLAHRAGLPSACEPSADELRPGAAQVTEFARIVLAGDAARAHAYVEELRDLGMSAETIYLDLLAAVARHFGVLWETDQSDFVAVTVGLQRLQELAYQLSQSSAQPADAPRSGHRVLLLAMPGDQHVFGSMMVADFLRRAGWDVWDAPGANEADILSLVEHEWFAIVGVSISRPDQLESLAGFVRALRRASSNRRIGVMVGGNPFSAHPERVAMVGADTTASDGRDAVLQAERLLQLLGQRN